MKKAGLPFDFIDAIDGHDMTAETLRLHVDPDRYALRQDIGRPGAVGCALSHRAIYETMVEEGIAAAVVLEDDVIVSDTFADALPALRDQLLPDEVHLFFQQSNVPIRLARDGAVDLAGNHRLMTVSSFEYFGGAIGYLIPLETAARLIKVQRPVRAFADDWAYFFQQGAVRSFRLTVPFLVRPAGFPSVIGYRDGHDPGVNLLRLAENRIPPLAKLLRLVRRTRGRHRQTFLLD